MKLRWVWPLTLSCLLVASGGFSRADEWTKSTPFYEDDAWYDVSEWFDGNDYNPTDEVVGRWDDETYDAAQDTGTDVDNDWNTYGYGDYDYGGFDADSNLFSYNYRYYDFDKDGNYDAVLTYYDWNGDGLFEDVDYVVFNEAGSQGEQQARQQAQDKETRSSRLHSITGTIQSMKEVQLGKSGKKHTRLTIKQDDDNQVLVDLGKAKNASKMDLKEGKTVTVWGPITKIGDQKLLLAQSIEIDGAKKSLEPDRKTYSGKIVELREVKVGDHKNQLVILESQKQQGRKVAVDLGRVDRLGFKPSKGQQLTVTGAPIKSRDKLMVLAFSLEHDGKKVQIDRQKEKGDQIRQAARPK